MTPEERWEMLSKEKLKFDCVGTFEITKEEEIQALKDLTDCIKQFENRSDEELKKFYEEGLREIEDKYNK